MKYIKKNEFIQGIPARDLTPDEWVALPKELQETALKSGVYEMPKKSVSKDGE